MKIKIHMSCEDDYHQVLWEGRRNICGGCDRGEITERNHQTSSRHDRSRRVGRPEAEAQVEGQLEYKQVEVRMAGMQAGTAGIIVREKQNYHRGPREGSRETQGNMTPKSRGEESQGCRDGRWARGGSGQE